MNPRITLLLATLLAFGTFTATVLLDVGYVGIFDAAFASGTTTQVLLDLVLVCGLASLWLIGDARKRGVRAWPWLLAIGVGGSLGLLSYLVARELGAMARARGARTPVRATAGS